MTKLQLRYLRNVFAAWVVVVGLYCGFWWCIPIGYIEITILFGLGALIYGIWFFRQD